MASRRVCTVCCKHHAQYTCPRCHKVYCSSACYKAHSQTCSEAFYREQATAQLKATRAGPEQTQQMLEVLQRLHEQQQQLHGSGFDEDSASDADGSISDSSSDKELDGSGGNATAAHKLSPAFKQLLKRAQREGPSFEVVPSDLTPELQQQLEALVLQGQLSHLVTPWSPWWYSDTAAALQLNTAGQHAVQDLQQLHHIQSMSSSPQHQQQQRQQEDGAAGDGVRVAPAGGSGGGGGLGAGGSGLPQPSELPLPSLQQLAGHRPSPLLPWQLLQLLVSYCAVMRQFNGEPEAEGGWEAAQHLLLLAPPLVQAAVSAGGGSSSSSSSSSSRAAGSAQGTAAAQGLTTSEPAEQPAQQQQQGSQQLHGTSILPADSVRLACLQLLDAAAAADAVLASSGSERQLLQEQLSAVAAAVSASGGASLTAERRALLQVAEADALKLLQLGRSAVVLALTDSRRLLLAAKEIVKHGLQQPQQQQRQRRQLQQLRHFLNLAGQKLWYYMVWSNQQADGRVFQVLADELGRELQDQQALLTPPARGVSLTGKPELLGAPRMQSAPGKPAVVVVGSSGSSDAAVEGRSSAAAVDAGQPSVSGLYDLD